MIIFLRLLALAALLLLWWLAALLGGSNLIPDADGDRRAARGLFADGRIYGAIGESLSVYGGGYLLAVLVGIPTGLLMGGFRLLGRTLEIYVNALTATPRVAFIRSSSCCSGSATWSRCFPRRRDACHHQHLCRRAEHQRRGSSRWRAR